jgi:hypothetical protein
VTDVVLCSVEQSRSLHISSPARFGPSSKAGITPTTRASASVKTRLPDDEITLRYYIERKAELNRLAGRKVIAGDLMPHLSSILGTALDATIIPRENKVPFEIQAEDGTIQHASGYIPPTAAQLHFDAGVVYDSGLQQPDRVQDIDVPPNKSEDASMSAVRGFHTAAGSRATVFMKPPVPRASFQTSAVRKARQRESDDDITMRYYIERKAERESVEERKAIEGDLMPALSANIITEGFGVQITAKEEKVPVEILAEDGTVQHASGFVPPTPAEVHEASGVVAHGFQAHDAAATVAARDPAQDASDSDAVPVESRGHRPEEPAGQTKPRTPPSEPSGETASSFGARI